MSEVERIEGEMREIVEEMGFGHLTLREFISMIREDRNNYYSSPEQLLAAFHHIIEDIIDDKLLEVPNKYSLHDLSRKC